MRAVLTPMALAAALAGCRASTNEGRGPATAPAPTVAREARRPIAPERPATSSRLTVDLGGACAGFASGDVACWGGAHWRTPTRLHFDSVGALSCEGAGCCVLTEAGEVHCWDRALLGVASRRWSLSGRDFQGVAVSYCNACVLERNGGMVCWETNPVAGVPPSRLLTTGGLAMHTRLGMVCVAESHAAPRC